MNRYKGAIEHIQDVLIVKVLEESESEEEKNENSSEKELTDLATFMLIEHINDIHLMSQTLLQHINRISDEELASQLIRTVLLHRHFNELPTDEIEQLRKYSTDITLYANIGRATAMTDLLPYDTWTKVMEISRLAPERLLHSLVERNQYELCYQWMQTVKLQNIVVKSQFIDLFLAKIQERLNTNDEHFIKVSEIILKVLAKQTDSQLLLKMKNHKLLQYLVDILIESSAEENRIYNNYKITLSIFDVIDSTEVDTLWHLVETPMLIIEQYIINSKFETLSRIFQSIRPQIKNYECSICQNTLKTDGADEHIDVNEDLASERGRNFHVNYKDHVTSVQCVDHILRIYAAKALDFHIGSSTLTVSTASILPVRSISLDSVCDIFMMPRETPDKSDWVKDTDATHCMCCKRSRFTMLTRRHHCRRCGRVVCHSCSNKRLLIPKLYDNVMVRVCSDCFKQTNEALNMVTETQSANPTQATDESSSLVMSIFEPSQQPISSRSGWIYCFTGNLKHDNLLREEFSFEYAPSASLCLNLLSMHTPGQDCCDFLLSYCKKFEALLKPLKPGHANPEVDYAFVTRILYCLSFAAKVIKCHAFT